MSNGEGLQKGKAQAHPDPSCPQLDSRWVVTWHTGQHDMGDPIRVLISQRCLRGTPGSSVLPDWCST